MRANKRKQMKTMTKINQLVSLVWCVYQFTHKTIYYSFLFTCTIFQMITYYRILQKKKNKNDANDIINLSLLFLLYIGICDSIIMLFLLFWNHSITIIDKFLLLLSSLWLITTINCIYAAKMFTFKIVVEFEKGRAKDLVLNA